MGSFKVDLLAGNFEVYTNFGDIKMGTLIGTAELHGSLKSSVTSMGIAELSASIVAVEADMRMYAGLTGSTDSIVTALKISMKMLTEIMIKFNTHTHPIIPLIGPTLLPTSVMSPINPLDISNKTSLS